MVGSLSALERRFGQAVRQAYRREGVSVEEVYEDDDEAAANAYFGAKYARPAWDPSLGQEPPSDWVLVVIHCLRERPARAPWQTAAEWAQMQARQAARARALEAKRLEEEMRLTAAQLEEERLRASAVVTANKAHRHEVAEDIAEGVEAQRGPAPGLTVEIEKGMEAALAEKEATPANEAPPAAGERALSLSLGPDGRRRPQFPDGQVRMPQIGEE